MNARLSSWSLFTVACLGWCFATSTSCSDDPTNASNRAGATSSGSGATTGTSGSTTIGAGGDSSSGTSGPTTGGPGSSVGGGSVGSGGSSGSTGPSGSGGSCAAAFEEESLQADPCAGVKAWDKNEVWNNYNPGDLRVYNGSLWSCHTPAWCQTEPGGPQSSLGWDAEGMCSGTTTGAGGSSGAGGSRGAGGSTGSSGTAGSSSVGSTGAGGTCGNTPSTSTGSAGATGSGGRAGGGGAAGAGGTGGLGGSGGSGNPPPGGCILDTLLPAKSTTFDAMFQPPWQGHVPSPVLSYQGLCQALANPGFAAFARSGTAEQNERELAAFLAQVAKETAYLEKPVQDGAVSGSTEWGRGAMQLTHSYNYAAAGAFLGMDLVSNPDIVGRDTVLAWATGLWFWMKYHNTNAGTDPTCHDLIMMGSFGETTRKINAISCGGADAATRGSIFQSNCGKLGITVGGATTC